VEAGVFSMTDLRLMPVIGHGKFMKISSRRDELLAILNNKALELGFFSGS
jgi:hypothetical protein